MSLEDVAVDLDYETPFLDALRRRAAGGPARRGRHLRRARRARGRSRRRPRGRHVLRAQPARPLRPLPPCRRRRRPRLVRLVRPRLQAAAARARGIRRCSLTTCATSSRDRARPRLRPPRRALRALPRRRQRAPPRPRRGRRPSRRLELAVARRAFALLRALEVDFGDPHLPAARRSTRRRATSSTSRDAATAYETLYRAGVLDALAPAARPPAAARRRPPLLCRRLLARRAARRGDAERPERPAPGDPHGRDRRSPLPRGRRGARRRRAPCPGARPHAAAYAKGTEAIADVARRRRRRRPRPRARGASRARCDARRREPARERRPRQPRPHEPGRARPARGSAPPRSRRACPTTCMRSRSSDFAIRPRRPPSSRAAASPPIVEGERLPETPPFAGAFRFVNCLVIRCKSSSAATNQEAYSNRRVLLVRRWIQTPSAARSRAGEGPGGSSSELPGPPAVCVEAA